MVTLIEVIRRLHNIQEGEVMIGCDGLQAICNVSYNIDITSPKIAHFDLIGAI